MITLVINKIKISETEALEMAAYWSDNAIYDKVNEELTFTVKEVTNSKLRLVYVNGKVVTLVEGTDLTITSTIFTVEEFDSNEQAVNRIEELNLEHI